MTGEKDRYKPLDRLAGLNDRQLSTPKHDEMVLWLLKEDNIKLLFDNEIKEMIIPIQEFKDKIKINLIKEQKLTYDECYDPDEYHIFKPSESEWRTKQYELIGKLQSEYDDIPDEPKINIISESPITSGNNNFIIGYWDLKVELLIGKIVDHYDEGYDDHEVSYRSSRNEPNKIIYVEVKPKIESFGETLRQLRTYQEIERRSKCCTYLFSNDDTFKEAFESQGIKFIMASDVM